MLRLTVLILAVSSLLAFAESAKKGKSAEMTTFAPAVAAATNGTNTTASSSEGSSCRKFMMVMAKRMMKVLNSCTKEVKAQYQDQGTFNEHFQCTIKCFMHKTQMIDQNYKLSEASWETFSTVHLPESYHALAMNVSKPCLDIYVAKIDPNDPKCIMYGEYVKCLQDIASKACA